MKSSKCENGLFNGPFEQPLDKGFLSPLYMGLPTPKPEGPLCFTYFYVESQVPISQRESDTKRPMLLRTAPIFKINPPRFETPFADYH